MKWKGKEEQNGRKSGEWNGWGSDDQNRKGSAVMNEVATTKMKLKWSKKMKWE